MLLNRSESCHVYIHISKNDDETDGGGEEEEQKDRQQDKQIR